MSVHYVSFKSWRGTDGISSYSYLHDKSCNNEKIKARGQFYESHYIILNGFCICIDSASPLALLFLSTPTGVLHSFSYLSISVILILKFPGNLIQNAKQLYLSKHAFCKIHNFGLYIFGVTALKKWICFCLFMRSCTLRVLCKVSSGFTFTLQEPGSVHDLMNRQKSNSLLIFIFYIVCQLSIFI